MAMEFGNMETLTATVCELDYVYEKGLGGAGGGSPHARRPVRRR